MTAVKYRVWDTVRKQMFKIQAITFDVQTLDPFAVSVPGRSWEPISKFELLQWTGLKDEEGTSVYEGDVVKIGSTLFEVAWNSEEACFQLLNKNNPGEKLPIIRVFESKVAGHRFQDL